jgi:hypothetical protein
MDEYGNSSLETCGIIGGTNGLGNQCLKMNQGGVGLLSGSRNILIVSTSADTPQIYRVSFVQSVIYFEFH